MQVKELIELVEKADPESSFIIVGGCGELYIPTFDAEEKFNPDDFDNHDQIKGMEEMKNVEKVFQFRIDT
jgi:hypothetical protein